MSKAIMILDTPGCCGTCKYHEKDGSDWICVCRESDEFSDYTDYEFVCEEWKERSTK